jgi:nitrogen fixation/metabolism regulation signal transduction histidine kinase
MAPTASRRGVIVISLSVCLLVLFLALATLNAFNLDFLNPGSPLQTLIFIGLSVVAFLLFVGVLVLLVRNVLKLYADQRSRVLGTRLRTRMLWGAVLVSLVPLVFMFAFSYLLMNRAVDRWFSQPVTQMREDANQMALELFRYAAANARSEADSMAIELGQTSFAASAQPNDAALAEANRVLERHALTLQGGFAMVYRDGKPVVSLRMPKGDTGKSVITSLQPPEASDDESPDPHPAVVTTRLQGPIEQAILQAAERNDDPFYSLGGADYTLATAGLPQGSLVVAGLPIPAGIAATSLRLRASADAYWTMYRERKVIRDLYMFLLLLTTSLALFACCWLALNLSKQVTKPVESLADAMEAIAGGDYAHRVAESATVELGELVASFNAMATDLESAHDLAERSTAQLSALNQTLQARRTELETIIETIPNGVVTLSAERRIVLANRAFSELLDPGGQRRFVGLDLDAVLPTEIVETIDNLLRRAHRMGSASGEMQMQARTSAGRGELQLSATVALLEGGPAAAREHLGYVLVLEDATELLRAQKQSAWKEVARRVAHEIKNPLTPISLNAELTRRHVGRIAALLTEHQIESPSPAIIQRSSEVISSSVETMRSLVDQFSSLAEFPTARPQPADLNIIVEDALALFGGRLGDIRVRLNLARRLPLVLADPQALKRALTNLIDNAAEAMQDALLRELHISTRLLTAEPGTAGMVELTVADTGPGLTDEMRERLFLPYFSTKQRGTGLGLSIAAKILQEHQGSIRAEKNLPTGAKFILELRPASESVNAPATEAGAPHLDSEMCAATVPEHRA